MGRFALLIGVGTYESSELQNLKAAIPDVRAIEKVLIDPAIAEFAQIDVEILLDPEPQRMREAIERLFTDRKKDDLVLLYFSGHGEINDYGNFYFTSTITRRNRLASTAIPATFVHGLMEECKSQQQVMILDACYSGAFASGMKAKGGEVDLNVQFGGKGRAVLTSSSPIEQSFEQKERELSVYTQYIEEGLRTGIADRDEDGWISIDELHEFAREKVREVAPAMQPKIYAVEEGYKIVFAKAPMKSMETVKRKTEEDSNSGLSYENFLSEGLNKYHLKDFKCAIENFNKVIEINQNFSYAYYIRGNSRSNLNDHKGAIEDFNKAIELNSNYANAYYNRGNCRGNLRDYQGAIDDFNRVIILNPDHANAYYRRGNYRGNLRDYKRAIKDYTKAIELKHDYANTYFNRGLSRFKISDNKGAIEDYTKAIELKPDYADAYYNRAVSRSNLSDNKGAIEDYTKAIELKPDYAVAYNNRGVSRKNLSDYKGAIEDYTKAIELKPDHANAYFNRGISRQALSENDKAIADYQKAAYLSPADDPLRQRALDEITKLQ